MPKQLLMEGYDPDLASTLQYVNESGATIRYDGGSWLTESGEKTDDPKELYIQGVFQREGVKNANGRIYPNGMFERLLAEDHPVAQRIKSGSMVGEVEHPADGISRFERNTIKIVELRKPDANGMVWGKALVMRTDPYGKNVIENVRCGVNPGISSRGRGTVGSDGVVNEDYELETFDIVSKPSTPGAFLKTAATESTTQVAESASQTPNKGQPMSFNLSTFEAQVRPLIEQDVTQLPVFQRAEFTAKLLGAVQEAAQAIKDPSTAALVQPILAELQAKRTAIAEAEKAGKTSLEEKNKALEEQLATVTAERDASVKLCEAMADEFTKRLNEAATESEEEELDESESEDDSLLETAREHLAEALTVAAGYQAEAALWKSKFNAAVGIIESLTAPKVLPEAQQIVAKPEEKKEDKPVVKAEESVSKSETTPPKVDESTKPSSQPVAAPSVPSKAAQIAKRFCK